MVVNQLVFTHRTLREHKLSHFPTRYYIVLDVLSLMRQNWLLYSNPECGPQYGTPMSCKGCQESNANGT